MYVENVEKYGIRNGVIFLSTGFSAFSTFFSTGLLRGDGGCRPVDVKAFKACGGLTCRELCTACGKKWACFFAGIG